MKTIQRLSHTPEGDAWRVSWSGPLARAFGGFILKVRMRSGVVYTDTVVHLAPERFAADVPYQIIIVKLDDGSRVTARVDGDRVVIDDRVVEAGVRDGIPYFRKDPAQNKP